MEHSYLVSVVMPVYNAEQFLKRSVESVLGQSYDNVELILVNDGSTDTSESICNTYAQIDNRVKLITQKNGGPAAARNTGIAHATGTFVYFLDADDYIDVKAFETLIAAYDAHPSEMVLGNFCKVEGSGQIIDQSVSFTPNGQPFEGVIKILSKDDISEYVRHFLKHPSNHLISYCWGRLYKLSIIREYSVIAPGNMRLFEDFVLNLEYLKHCNSVTFINKPLYTYVMQTVHVSASMAAINADSLLHDMNIFKEKTIEFFRKTGSGLAPAVIEKEIGHALTHYVIIFVIRSCRLVTEQTEAKIRHEIDKIIDSPIFKESVRHYNPQKGNSRILPMLAKYKLIGLIVVYCRYKANKRYGKIKK